MKKLFMFCLFILIVGCGGGSSSSSSNNTSGDVSLDKDLNILVKTNLKISKKETPGVKTNLKVTNFQYKVDGSSSCIKSASPTSTQEFIVEDSIVIPIKVQIDKSCTDKNKLEIFYDEIVTKIYKGGFKEVKTISKNIEINLNRNFNGIDVKAINLSSVIFKGQQVTFNLQILYNNAQADDNNIEEVEVKTLDASKVRLLNNKKEVNSIVYSKDSYHPITIIAKDKGEANLSISLKYKIGNNVFFIEKNIPVNVVSENIEENYSISINILNIPSLYVDKEEKLVIIITDKDGNMVDKALIRDVNITSLMKLLYFDKNKTKNVYEFNESNPTNVTFYTDTKAGEDIIEIKANINGEIITKSQKVVIYGDEPHTISIIHMNSTFDITKNEYIDRYRIFASDKFGNKARAGSVIRVGVVGGLRKDSNENELYVDKNGTIKHKNDHETDFILDDTNKDFSKVESRDTLIVLGNDIKHDPLYLGGWIVKNVVNNYQLTLDGNYSGDVTNQLTFLIGDDRRYDNCSNQNFGLYFDSENREYILDENGETYFELHYPSYFIGKTVYLYANYYGKQRVGTSLKEIVRGTGIISSEGTCNKSNCDVNISFTLKDSNEFLKNVTFPTLEAFDFTEECNLSNATISKSNTQCNGIITISNVGDKNTSNDKPCIVNWNNKLYYEH